MVMPERLSKVRGSEPFTARLEMASNQGKRSRPTDTISKSNSVTSPSLVALPITAFISIAPTKTQAAIATVNKSAGARRLKIRAMIRVATMRAISNDSIDFVACKSSEQNTRSLDDTKTPKSGYPPASPISFIPIWARAICRVASANNYFFQTN